MTSGTPHTGTRQAWDEVLSSFPIFCWDDAMQVENGAAADAEKTQEDAYTLCGSVNSWRIMKMPIFVVDS